MRCTHQSLPHTHTLRIHASKTLQMTTRSMFVKQIFLHDISDLKIRGCRLKLEVSKMLFKARDCRL